MKHESFYIKYLDFENTERRQGFTNFRSLKRFVRKNNLDQRCGLRMWLFNGKVYERFTLSSGKKKSYSDIKKELCEVLS